MSIDQYYQENYIIYIHRVFCQDKPKPSTTEYPPCDFSSPADIDF